MLSRRRPQHRCSRCGQNFCHSSELWEHMQDHLIRRFPCSICKENFDSPRAHKRHISSHNAVESNSMSDTSKKAEVVLGEPQNALETVNLKGSFKDEEEEELDIDRPQFYNEDAEAAYALSESTSEWIKEHSENIASKKHTGGLKITTMKEYRESPIKFKYVLGEKCENMRKEFMCKDNCQCFDIKPELSHHIRYQNNLCDSGMKKPSTKATDNAEQRKHHKYPERLSKKLGHHYPINRGSEMTKKVACKTKEKLKTLLAKRTMMSPTTKNLRGKKFHKVHFDTAMTLVEEKTSDHNNVTVSDLQHAKAVSKELVSYMKSYQDAPKTSALQLDIKIESTASPTKAEINASKSGLQRALLESSQQAPILKTSASEGLSHCQNTPVHMVFQTSSSKDNSISVSVIETNIQKAQTYSNEEQAQQALDIKPIGSERLKYKADVQPISELSLKSHPSKPTEITRVNQQQSEDNTDSTCAALRSSKPVEPSRASTPEVGSYGTPFKCLQCDLQFSSLPGILQHMDLKHSDNQGNRPSNEPRNRRVFDLCQAANAHNETSRVKSQVELLERENISSAVRNLDEKNRSEDNYGKDNLEDRVEIKIEPLDEEDLVENEPHNIKGIFNQIDWQNTNIDMCGNQKSDHFSALVGCINGRDDPSGLSSWSMEVDTDDLTNHHFGNKENDSAGPSDSISRDRRGKDYQNIFNGTLVNQDQHLWNTEKHHFERKKKYLKIIDGELVEENGDRLDDDDSQHGYPNIRSQLAAQKQGRSSDLFRCSICSKLFQTQGSLTSHMSYTHHGLKQYKCPQCPEHFKYTSQRRDHVWSHHGGKMPYTCPHCQSSFVSRYQYDEHLRTHSGQKRYKCHYCYKGFHRISNMNRHIFSLHRHAKKEACVVICSDRTVYVCPVCGKAHRRRVALYNHVCDKHASRKTPASIRTIAEWLDSLEPKVIHIPSETKDART